MCELRAMPIDGYGLSFKLVILEYFVLFVVYLQYFILPVKKDWKFKCIFSEECLLHSSQ